MLNIKKLLVGGAAGAIMLGATIVPAFAANTISFGTVGTGATATPIGSSVELYTPAGGTGSGYVRLNIPDGIALNAITSLSYTAKVTTIGTGGYAPEVVINIDANGNNILGGQGIDWMLSGYVPATLSGDNFLSGDENPPTKISADSDFVTINALGGYSYWAANDARDGFGSLYNSFAAIVPGMLPIHDINPTDKVYSIDFVVGTSGNFDGMRALFNSVELNEVTYPIISPFAIPAACENIEGLGAPIIGTNGSDKINGTSGNDLIFALGGSDKVDGKGGNDCIVGGDGSDKLIGGNGKDVILGGNDSDSLEGNDGADKLYGENGSDSLKGDNGNDILDGGDGSDSAKGGSGTDTCTAESIKQCET